MKFPQNFLAGAGVLTARAGGEITGVCTALDSKLVGTCAFLTVY